MISQPIEPSLDFQDKANVQTRPGSDLSDIFQVFEVMDIFILLKISTGYFKYFVHALYERPP
jgi:hypothetical protein